MKIVIFIALCFMSFGCSAGVPSQELQLIVAGESVNGDITDAGFIPPDNGTIYWLTHSVNSKVHTYDMKAHTVKEILEQFPTSISPLSLSWSPDGDKVACVDNNDLYIYVVGSKQLMRVTSDGATLASQVIWLSESTLLYAADDPKLGGGTIMEYRDGAVIRVFHPARGVPRLIGYANKRGRIFYDVKGPDNGLSPDTLSASLAGDTFVDIQSVALPEGVQTEGLDSISADGRFATLVALGGPHGDFGVPYIGDFHSGQWKRIALKSDININYAIVSPNGTWLLSVGGVETDSSQNAPLNHIYLSQLAERGEGVRSCILTLGRLAYSHGSASTD